MWFEDINLNTNYNYVSSRIRLSRNLDNYLFPDRLSERVSKNLVDEVLDKLDDLQSVEEESFQKAYLNLLSDLDKMTMRERRIINSGLASKKTTSGIMINDYEDVSLIINGEDHIRLQLISGGLALDSLLERANRFDDYINEHFNYAFDEKYGYLTSYPTILGTGMRASVTLHLPALSASKGIQNLVSNIGRFGVEMRGIYGEGKENHGNLYEISNPKTLGQTEREIIEQVAKVAYQLNAQESSRRYLNLKDNYIGKQDEVYKSYGVLKYARKISLTDSLHFLSSLLEGVSDKLIVLDKPETVYGLMIGVQPSNLLKLAEKPLNKMEIDVARAEYIRKELPKIVE